jgi:hypothetical protein
MLLEAVTENPLDTESDSLQETSALRDNCGCPVLGMAVDGCPVLGMAVDGCPVLGMAVDGCPVLGSAGPTTGRHESPSPMVRHEQTGTPLLALMLHVLWLTVSGPKQSALALHDPHAPTDSATLGSPDDAVTVPLCRLQRW